MTQVQFYYLWVVLVACALACGSDENSGGATLPNCSAGQVIVWDGSEWACRDPDALPVCATNEVVAWDGSKWVCLDLDQDAVVPMVLATTPSNGAGTVERDVEIIVSFSEIMDPATIDSTTFTLQGDGGTVEAAVVVHGATVRLVPNEPLALAATYTATLGAGASDLAGNTIQAEETWSFAVRDGMWGNGVLLEYDNAGDADYPDVGIGGGGHAVATWRQSDGAFDNIWVSHYDPATGWGSASLFEESDIAASVPRVAVSRSGAAVVVWQQNGRAAARQYDSSSGWTWTTAIDNLTETVGLYPNVAMDETGNAIAVWIQGDEPPYDAWANRYTPTDGWGEAELIETGVETASLPAISMDASGNAIAVWAQGFDAWANRYTPADGWGTAERIENEASDPSYLSVAVDESGAAVAVWTQGGDVWANRYTPADGWGTAERIGTADGDPPSIAVGASGAAVAVWWRQGDIWANVFTPGGGWGTAEIIDQAEASGGTPVVAMDAIGNAVVAWRQKVDGSCLMFNRYTAAGAWGTAKPLVSSTSSGLCNLPAVASDRGGDTVVVWQHRDVSGAQTDIRAKQFE